MERGQIGVGEGFGVGWINERWLGAGVWWNAHDWAVRWGWSPLRALLWRGHHVAANGCTTLSHPPPLQGLRIETRIFRVWVV